jgi:hypothetical protein
MTTAARAAAMSRRACGMGLWNLGWVPVRRADRGVRYAAGERPRTGGWSSRPYAIDDGAASFGSSESRTLCR